MSYIGNPRRGFSVVAYNDQKRQRLARSTQDHEFMGFHKWPNKLEPNDVEDGDPDGHGSFEVFHHKHHCGPLESSLYELETGFYWWPCFPGCLPDGEATGPFPTAEGAYLDAIGD